MPPQRLDSLWPDDMKMIVFSDDYSYKRIKPMRIFTTVIEKRPDTGLYVGYLPGFPGAYSQGKTLDELNHNLKEAIELLLKNGEPRFETKFVGTQNVSRRLDNGQHPSVQGERSCLATGQA
jgi:predicted RNase H-like HicB family nuclease